LWLFRKPYTEKCKVVGEEPPEHLLPWSDVSAALIALGDAIAQRVAASVAPRAATARRAWAERGAKSMGWLRWATLLPVDALPGLVDPSQGANAVNFGEPEHEEPVAAAARLSAPFPVPDRLRLVRAVARHQQGASPRAAPRLTQLRRELPPHPLHLNKPFVSAYALAAWVRERFGLPHDRVDIEGLLRDLGVCVVDLDPTLPDLDAVVTLSRAGAACIFINPTGAHVMDSPGGRRATLAHELCHLLVDLGVDLPLAEVLGGTASTPHEQRARAFAAELLLPREIAAAELRTRMDAEGSPDLWGALSHLTSRYEVSKQLAALQIENSDARPLIIKEESIAFLRKMKGQMA
jgi:Zn-dependent peptidase ImmA (M78 family)